MTDTRTPGLVGLHHLTVPVTDLLASSAWFERVLGARRDARLDHDDDAGRRVAVILVVTGLGTLLQLRIDPVAVAGVRGFLPITFQVDDVAHLRSWSTYLDAVGIEHSGVERRNVGHSVSFATPDGMMLRLQTRPDVPIGDDQM